METVLDANGRVALNRGGQGMVRASQQGWGMAMAMTVAAVGAGTATACVSAHAARVPRALVSDGRVRQVTYDPNQVVEIVGTYGYQTSLEFGDDERIQVVSLGDSIAWQAVPYRNRLFLKPVEPDAATNLTVMTDKRTYLLALRSAAPRAAAAATYVVRFRYDAGALVAARGNGVGRAVPSACMTAPGTRARPVNRQYRSAGDRTAIALHSVCDDGQFTYFRFAPGTDIPAVYVVGADGTEALTNTRREGDYLVVERRATRFTLRSGRAYLCVQDHAGAAPKEEGNYGAGG